MKWTGKVAGCGVLLFAASLNAAAAEPGYYFGALGGHADYSFVQTPYARFFGPGDEDNSTAWGLTVGYRPIRYAAFEVDLMDLGQLEYSQTSLQPTFPPGPFSHLVEARFSRELKTRGFTVAALGILPIRDSWSVYARAGVFFARMDLTLTQENYPVGNGSNTLTSSYESLLWGAGTQVDFGAHWSVHADFQRFNNVGDTDFESGGGRADIDLLSLGVIFRL